MQDELRREVLDFSRGEATKDLGRVRIASKAVHQAMMGFDLDLSFDREWDVAPSVDQLMALGRGTTFHKFTQVPVEQRCSCAAGRALGHTGVGSSVPMDGWNAVPDHDRLAVGVGRSWRVTGLNMFREHNGVTLEQWRQLLRELNLADSLTELQLLFAGDVVDVSSTEPSIFSTLIKLTYLSLCEVSGSLSFLQSLTQLQTLDLAETQVSGSLSFLQNLTKLQHLSLYETQVSGSLSFVQNLTQLQKLNLQETQVSGSLSFLQNLAQLRYLSLCETQVNGSLSFLKNLTQLQQLDLSHTQVSGSLSFLQNLTQLQRLSLYDNKVSGSLSFLQNLIQLQGLHLSNTQVSGSLSFLQNHTQLQDLYLDDTQVSGIITALPQLTSLSEFHFGVSQVGVPTGQELTTFLQQHPDCAIDHGP